MRFLRFAVLGLLAGCGGGGGGGDDTPPPPPTFTVGGTISGLLGGVVLQNNGAGNLSVSSNGAFTFTGSVTSGAAYNVTVLTQPGLQTCTVSNGSGSASANVTNIVVACADVAPPTLALSVAKTKLFRFAWNSVARVSHYRLLEDASGSSGFTQVGTDIAVTNTAIEQVTRLYSRFSARYILQACSTSRCIDSNTVNVTGSLADAIGHFKASNPHFRAEFGNSLAISSDGTTMAVGAPLERSLATGIDGDQSDAGAVQAGAVYVFVRAGNAWVQQAYVKASNTHPNPAFPGDRFGQTVALSADGSVLAVGAEFEDSNATGVGGNQVDESAPNAGAVYVFGRTGTVWSQQAYIKASNTGAGDHFGGSQLVLSADGRTLAAGANGEDSSARGVNGTGTDNQESSGAVYVFARPADVWQQQAYIKASNTGTFDGFGFSLALAADGNTLAVSAPGEDSTATGANGDQNSDLAVDSGAVYVFGRAGTNWSQQAYLKASNTQEGDAFGFAVALSGDGSTLAVGAINEDSGGAAAGENDDSAEDAGAVYVFARAANNVWAPREAYLKASNSDTGDVFGITVALSADGQTLVVGAMQERSLATGIGGDETDNAGNAVGAAYVFKRAGASWSQHAYLKPSNSATAARFARTVAISADASVLAVGALGEDSNAPGINGDETTGSGTFSGAVYLY